MSGLDINKVLKKLFPNIRDVDNDFVQKILFPNGEYMIDGVYGFGSNGVVYKVLDDEKQNWALKLSLGDEEFKIQKDFEKYNMAPKLKKYGKIDNYKVFYGIMEPIYKTLTQYLSGDNVKISVVFNALKCLIKKKYLAYYPRPYIHGDMGLDNIVILNDRKTLGFIDFGFSSREVPAFQLLDMISLVSSIKLFNQRQNIKRRQKGISEKEDKLSPFIIKFYDFLFSLKEESGIDTDKIVLLQESPFGSAYLYGNGKVLYQFKYKITEDDIISAFPSIHLPRVV